MLAKTVHFFIAYFLDENSKFGIETLHAMKDNHWVNEKRHICFKSYIHETKFGLFNNFAIQKWRIELIEDLVAKREKG